MADRSKIEWTDASWNPIRARSLQASCGGAAGKVGWHCEHVSEGCRNCYAEGINKRLGTGLPFKPAPLDNGIIELFLDETMLTQPLRWKKPRRVFVGSMTDLFGRFVMDAMLDRIFAVMALCPQHTFQVLTKRSERMRDYIADCCRELGRQCDLRTAVRDLSPWPMDHLGDHIETVRAIQRVSGAIGRGWKPLPNVWLGVSAERQEEADARIPDLLATPAAVRFVSLEPLLGHIDLHALNLATETPSDALRGVLRVPNDVEELTEPTAKLDWVIAGGESGLKARSMHPDWARSLRDQCQAAGVAFFFKQWGEWAPSRPEDCAGNPRSGWQACAAHPHVAKAAELYPEAGAKFVARVGKKAAGRLLDDVEHNAMPERARP